MTTACALAFGGNSAASEELFQHAIAELDKAEVHIVTFANTIGSSPMGIQAGSEFRNSAGLFQTTLSAEELLLTIHKIESKLGRQRSIHWGPRPIDIDVVFFGDEVIDTDRIVIPHPCAWYRSFVLNPLAEICPEWIHPVLNETVQQLKQRLERRPLFVQIESELAAWRPDQIASQFSNNDGQQVFRVLKTPHEQERFCRIVVEAAGLEQRCQPRLETQRTIRCPLKPGDGEVQLCQFLRDFEAAVQG